MLILKGYKCESNCMAEIEDAIQRLQELICIQGRKLYTELFANEIESLCDDIGFGNVPRPNIPVYDAAHQALDLRISDATGHGYALPYNFGVQVSVYTYQNNVYIRLNASNERLMSALKRTPAGLTDFSLYDNLEANVEQKDRESTWNEIMSIYSKEWKPLVRNIFACEDVKPEWKQISKYFHSREDRAETRIRYQLINHMINLLGMGQQIPAHKLLPTLEEALKYAECSAAQADAKRMMPQAMQCVINITEELAMQDPQAAVMQ